MPVQGLVCLARAVVHTAAREALDLLDDGRPIGTGQSALVAG